MWRRRQLGTKVSRSRRSHDVLRDRPWLMGRQIRIRVVTDGVRALCRARLVGRFIQPLTVGIGHLNAPQYARANVTSTTLRVSTSL